MKDKASLFELENVYNYIQACKLHAMLDMTEDYERYQKMISERK